MAQAPTTGDKPKRKQQGPRTVKDKVLIMGYKGEFAADGKPRFFPNSNDAMDALMADRALQIEKITLPRGKPRKSANGDAPTGDVTKAA